MVYYIQEVFAMTKEQETILKEAEFSLSVEGLYVTDEERQNLIDVLEGRKSYKNLLEEIIAKGYAYGRI